MDGNAENNILDRGQILNQLILIRKHSHTTVI